MAISKNRGPLLTSKYRGSVDNFPREFLAFIGLDVYSQEVPVDIDIDPITGFLVESKLVQERDNERKKTNTFLTETPGGELESEVRLDNGLIGTRIRSLVPVGTDLETDRLTYSADQNNLGNGWLDQTIIEAPKLFSDQSFSRSRPDVTPSDFGALLTTRETEETFFGLAEDPELEPGDIKVSDKQIDVFKHRLSRSAIDVLELPITNINKGTNQFKQVETITRILELDTETPEEPTSTKDVSFTKLGDGTALEVRTEVPVIFEHLTSSINVLNFIPPEFRGLIPDFEVSHVAEGQVVNPPSLSGTEIYRQEEQVDKFNKRVTIRNLGSPTLPITYSNPRIGGEQYGGEIMKLVLTLDDSALSVETGLGVISSETKTLSPSLFLRITEKWNTATAWPILSSDRYNEETQTHDTIETQVVAPTYNPADGTGFIEELEAIDQWRSRRIKTVSTPTATSEATAIVTERWAPFQFPGWLTSTGIGYYVRRTRAELCRQIIKTWFVNSATKPTVAVNEIIMDNPIINSLNDVTRIEYAGECLHDDYSLGSLFFPATTPTATEYVYGEVIGYELLNLITLYNPGTGYGIGDVLTITGDGHSTVVTVTSVGTAGSVLTYTPLVGAFDWPLGLNGPYTATGGSGTDAAFYVTGYNSPIYDDTNKWIGKSKVVAATVTQTKIKNQWKIQTVNIVMR